jgi:hypothetical protein
VLALAMSATAGTKHDAPALFLNPGKLRECLKVDVFLSSAQMCGFVVLIKGLFQAAIACF